MKEEFTINKPQIANDFIQMLYGVLKAEPSQEISKLEQITYKINEADLKECLIKLGNMIQERERSNFEQYTMFYENLLRQHHQMLYAREREIKSVKDELNAKSNEINVEVQCQMADTCYDLIMEVTALRAKLAEVSEQKANVEKNLREKVKAEFIDLVTDLVNVNLNLKSQIDEFK